MHEVVEHPEQVAHWQALAAGKPVDWNEVFAGYKSQVDWPGAYVWRQLSEAFPRSQGGALDAARRRLVEQLLENHRQADDQL